LLVLFALPECSKVGATCRSSFCQTLGSLQLPLSLVLLLDFASRRHFGPVITSVAGKARVAIAFCKCKLQSQYLLPFATSICQIMMLVLLDMLSAIAFRCTSLVYVSCLTMSRHEDDHVGLHVGFKSAPFCRGKWLWLSALPVVLTSCKGVLPRHRAKFSGGPCRVAFGFFIEFCILVLPGIGTISKPRCRCILLLLL